MSKIEFIFLKVEQLWLGIIKSISDTKVLENNLWVSMLNYLVHCQSIRNICKIEEIQKLKEFASGTCHNFLIILSLSMTFLSHKHTHKILILQNNSNLCTYHWLQKMLY